MIRYHSPTLWCDILSGSTGDQRYTSVQSKKVKCSSVQVKFKVHITELLLLKGQKVGFM